MAGSSYDPLLGQASENLCIDPSLITGSSAANLVGNRLRTGNGSFSLTQPPSSSSPPSVSNGLSQWELPTEGQVAYDWAYSENDVQQFGLPDLTEEMQNAVIPFADIPLQTHGTSILSPQPSLIPPSNNKITSDSATPSALASSHSSHSEPVPQELERLPPRACHVCGRSLGTQWALDRHLAKHERRFPCTYSGCNEIFHTKRTRDQHHDSRHRGSESPLILFRCRCGKETLRKDNHQRHLRSCQGVSIRQYRCFCGQHEVGDKEEHVAHIKNCPGMGKGGRQRVL